MSVAQSVLVDNKVIAGVQYTLGPGFHNGIFLETEEALITFAFRKTKAIDRESGERTNDYYNDVLGILSPKANVSINGKVTGSNIKGSLSSIIDRDRATVHSILDELIEKELISNGQKHQILRDLAKVLLLCRSRSLDEQFAYSI